MIHPWILTFIDDNSFYTGSNIYNMFPLIFPTFLFFFNGPLLCGSSNIFFRSVSLYILQKISVACHTTSNPYLRHKVCSESRARWHGIRCWINLLFIVMLTCPWNTAPENMPCVRFVRLIAHSHRLDILLGHTYCHSTAWWHHPQGPWGWQRVKCRGVKRWQNTWSADTSTWHRIPQGQMVATITLTPQNLGHVLLLLKTSCRITRDAVNTFVSWQLCDKHRIDSGLHQLSTHAAPDTVIGEPPRQACLGWHAPH